MADLDAEADGADARVPGIAANERIGQRAGSEGTQQAAQLQTRHPHSRSGRRHRLFADEVQEAPAGD